MADVELITFPDPEDVLPAFLRTALAAMPGFAGVPAAGRVPSPRPARFVVVTVTGGADVDHLSEEVVFVTEAWARTDADAARLAAACRSALGGASLTGRLGDVPVRTIATISRPQRLPDPRSQETRYTFTSALRWRGTPT